MQHCLPDPDAIRFLKSNLGNIANLDTSVKTSIVDAINAAQAEIDDAKAGLDTLIKYGALDVNLSNIRAAYPAYTVDSAPALTNSKSTLTFINALKVEKGKKYTLKMTNGANTASASSRHSVIVADNKVVQVIETAGTAGAEVNLDFEPVADGDLYIVVDRLFASLAVYGIIKESQETETPIPKAVKTALLDCLEEYAHVSTTGRTAFNALRNALGVLDDLNVTYTQSGTVYDSDTLDTLKSDLTVEAVYIDGTTETVTGYTLSGNLTAGTSKIKVAYLGVSREISVTVTANTALYHWDFKESLIDTVANKEFEINTDLNAFRSSLGLFYWGYREGVGTCEDAKVPLGGKAVIKFGAVNFVDGGNAGNGTIFSGAIGYAWRGSLSRYAVYNGSWSSTGAVDKPINYLSGKTLILSISATGDVEINVDGEVVAEIPAGLSEPYQLKFGETTARQTFRFMVIESVTIYGA